MIFSERIATLDWLAATVPGLLGLERDQHLVLHGGLADVKQMDVIEKFGLADNNVRLLFTGDMASEGVNLHRQCHHLIHFDLPWSLITIEQRNGRIDRYGQEHSPDIRALIQTPDHPRLTGDVRILSKLLQREQQAHKAFGESGSLLGLHDAGLEEESVMKSLSRGDDPDAIIPEEPHEEFDILALIGGATGNERGARSTGRRRCSPTTTPSSARPWTPRSTMPSTISNCAPRWNTRSSSRSARPGISSLASACCRRATCRSRRWPSGSR